MLVESPPASWHGRLTDDQMHELAEAFAWRTEAPERRRKWTVAWQQVNREKVRSYWHARRSRKTQSGGSYTRHEWLELCARYDHRCLACGKAAPLTVDHVIPIKHGGSSNITNIQPLCRPCNSRKKIQHTDYR